MEVNRRAESELVRPDRVPPHLKQRVLSAHVDDGTLAHLTSPEFSLVRRAHMKLMQNEGAGAWINAFPNEAVVPSDIPPHHSTTAPYAHI